ncbi:MAG: PAS domain S-box protein [candidate division NC10 bacterium]|nr:PAS domain S-box protein [candidate division NC10 bacterium]
MVSLLWTILTPQGFEPHGYCFLWTRPLLWLYIVSDSLITLSYYSIPIALIYFVRKRRDLAFRPVFVFFAVFIVACGTTHLMALWTIWSPLYWLDAAVKAVTAAASVGTAVALWPLIPKALALPSPAQLEAANVALQEEVRERHHAQEALRAAYDEMEERIRERTRELTRTAEALQAEIAEHEGTEHALQESENKYRVLVNEINDGLFAVDARGVITFANRALAQIHGLESPEQLVGRNLFEFIAPIALNHVKEVFTDAVDTGITADVVETQIVRPDGECVFIEVRSVPILEDGRVAGFRGILRDVTERKRSELALRETYDLLKAVIDASTAGITILDREGNVKLWSPAAERMFGWRKEEVLERPLPTVPSGRCEEHRVLRDRALAGEALGGVEVIRRKKDGSPIDISLWTAPLRDEQGGTTGIVGIMVDMTERKRTEAQIRLQAAALEAAANGIIITDRNGTIRWANAAFARLTGYTAEETIGRTPRLLRSGRHDQAFYHNLWETVLSGRVWQGEIVNRRKDGSLYTEAQTITPVPDEHGNIAHFIAIKQDMTEPKRLQENLRQAQKLAAIGLLAGGIAHDFNNLLNGIIGFAELALKELPEGSKGASYLSRVPRLGRQAAGLIGQMLAFARKAPLERRPLDLNPLLKEIRKLLRQTFPETITIQVEPALEALVANADPGEVQQIILNLATNARDAMPCGGALTLRLVPVTLTEASLGSHPHRRPGPFACLTVADTGTGIPSAIRDQIFEPFFTTKAPGHGTGLGLASVYGIVHQHEGWLEVETAEGQGSAFHVFLPIVPTPTDATPSIKEAMPHGRETLLFVEDNPVSLEMGETLLNDLGYTVLAAADGVEALAVFRTHPDIALVLTDAIMPRMGAVDLIPALRALNPDIQVLVCTGYAPDQIRRTLNHLRISGYIRKPFSQGDLATAVRTAIDGSVLGKH